MALSQAEAGIIRVDRDAAGANNGTSWSDAYRALSSALTSAVSGDEIWIAEGIYKPNDASGTPARDQWFQLKNGVGVYGGFAGNETAHGQRNPATHPTILSGDLSGDDADLDGDGFNDTSTIGDNCYHVFYHPSSLVLNSTAVLDGVTILGGNANGSSWPDNFGGGIFNYSSSPAITNCILWANSPSAQIVNSTTSSTPTVRYCVIQNGYTGGTNILSSDPLLMPLGSYGGPTQTMPVLAGSPAIDAGMTGEGLPITDQRGFVRGSPPDVGACEVQNVLAAVLVVTDSTSYSPGRAAVLTGLCEGIGLAYQWYSGVSGDTSNPITGATGRIFTSPPLTAASSFWLRASYANGHVDSATATVQVAPAIHVSLSGNDANDGLTWGTALRTLTTALGRATVGDEIWIAAGTYKPNDASGTTARDQWFQLKNGVGVYGGFASNETAREQRNPATHPTIFSGDLSGNDADLDGDGFNDTSTIADNCYHVFYHPSSLVLHSTAVLDGVTIRGGNANGSSPDDCGGGIYNSSCSPAITNTTVSNNTASHNGGGIFNYSSSSPAITNCILWANSPSAQIVNYYSSSTPTVRYCVIQNGYTGGTNILSSDPLIMPLGNYGGPTQTMPVSADSPARHAGMTGAGIPTTDQRGFVRGSPPDVGACEFQGATLTGAPPTAPATIGSALSAQVHSDHASPAYQWYLGQSGDTSNPIPGATGATLSYGPLEAGVSAWVRVTPGGGGTPLDSPARTLEVQGTYDQWCDFHALSGTGRDSAACPSADGIGNLLKFALGLNPAVRSARGLCGDYEYDDATKTLRQSWILSKTPTDLAVGVQWSSDLKIWSTDGLAESLIDSDAATETWQFSLPVGGKPRCFLQLRVQRNP